MFIVEYKEQLTTNYYMYLHSWADHNNIPSVRGWGINSETIIILN